MEIGEHRILQVTISRLTASFYSCFSYSRNFSEIPSKCPLKISTLLQPESSLMISTELFKIFLLGLASNISSEILLRIT